MARTLWDLHVAAIAADNISVEAISPDPLPVEVTIDGDSFEGTLDGGKWQHFALSWPEVVIGGGTPNVQKNIIAERILGLPKD